MDSKALSTILNMYEKKEIVVSNYFAEEERNYYNNPSLITTEAEFSSYSAKTRTFSFQSPADPLTVSSFEPYYKVQLCGWGRKMNY